MSLGKGGPSGAGKGVRKDGRCFLFLFGGVKNVARSLLQVRMLEDRLRFEELF